MALGIVGQKVGMTRIFDDSGAATPVTVIQVQKNRVTARKTADSDGYESVQVTAGAKKASHLTSAEKGHFAKAGVDAGHLKDWLHIKGRAQSPKPDWCAESQN